MARPPRVLCIMDMAGVGRSSLAVVLPVLAACGVQGCPLPTALFSTHTGGFGAPAIQDTAGYAADALRHYTEQQLAFDAIYTGYLLGDAQFEVAEAAQAQWPAAIKVADPAMGDNGEMYRHLTPATTDRMRRLCKAADLITPNYTETALLLGEEPTAAPIARQEMANRMARLADNGKQVLATSVPTPEHTMEIWGCVASGQDMYAITAYHVPQNYPGTGDAFTAAVVGLLVRGLPLRAAAEAAADFVRAAALATLAEEGDARHGVWFEGQLAMLTLTANSWQGSQQ